MMTTDKVDGYGKIFRFLTPLLIGFFGWVTVAYLANIDRKFEKIDTKFDSFIDFYHQIDKRVQKLEDRVFGYAGGDGNNGYVGTHDR